MGRSAKIGEPQALQDFKRRAKNLKRERGISHGEALEALADAEGFLDYAEVRQTLGQQVIVLDVASENQ